MRERTQEGKKNRTDNARNELYLRRQGGVGAFAVFNSLPYSGPYDGGGAKANKNTWIY